MTKFSRISISGVKFSRGRILPLIVSSLIRGISLCNCAQRIPKKRRDPDYVFCLIFQLDPAGWLPKCFVNRFNTKLVMIIENLRKIAQACPSEAEK